MAMLAGPRRRKRYNLCPRGKALYEDGNRYGTKMLEKMGWSKGKGLGANEDGAQEFVRVRFKNDAGGLGYEMRDDQWTTHEEGFNGLLKALNGEDSNEKETNGEASASEEDTRPVGFGFKTAQAAEADVVKPKKLKENISGVSLEEKSKYSKARVHYKKFTRGKDLAQYSEKDLANIFGKKVTEEIEVPKVEGQSDDEEKKPVNSNFAGVETVSTGLSVSDYFKQKMEAMKLRMASSKNCNVSAEDNEVTSTENNKENETERPMKKKNKDKHKEEEPREDIEIEEPPKKRKKSKRVAEEDLIEQGKEEPRTEEIDQSKRKKKKKDKQRVEEEHSVSIETAPAEEKSKAKNLKMTEEPIRIEHELNEMPAKKKSKKSKFIDEGTGEHVMDQNESIPEGDEYDASPAKKKSKTNKLECREEQTEDTAPDSEKPAKKKNKKNRTEAEEHPKQDTALDLEEVSERPAKKKSKKYKTEAEEQPKQDTAPEEAEVSEGSAKKKSKKYKTEAEEQPKPDTAPEEAEVSEGPAKKKSKKSKVEAEEVLSPPAEAEVSEKATKKKSKKSKTEDREEFNIEPEAEEETTSQTKRKSMKNNSNVETETTASESESKSNVSAADSAINSDNDSDSTSLTANANGILSMEELICKRDSFNIYKISTYSAERFHSFDMSAFKNASLSEIAGYRIDDNIQLEVVETKYDLNNIKNLWEGRESKYPYNPLVRNVFKKLKKNKRLLKSDIDRLKKCQAFTGI